jgi:hypothetical protein
MISALPKRVAYRKVASLAVVALILLGADQPQVAHQFAIACTGTARFTDNVTGRESVRAYPLPRRVYVLDETTKSVQHALEPRQEFENVCFRDGYIDSVSFSPGLISVRSEKAGDLCEFSVSRATGEGKYFSRTELGGGQFSQIEFQMTCDRAEIPVFDPRRNRF